MPAYESLTSEPTFSEVEQAAASALSDMELPTSVDATTTEPSTKEEQEELDRLRLAVRSLDAEVKAEEGNITRLGQAHKLASAALKRTKADHATLVAKLNKCQREEANQEGESLHRQLHTHTRWHAGPTRRA